MPQTTTDPKQPLGLAEIVHPFHPWRGERLPVLQVRRFGGREILSLSHPRCGTCGIRRDWTDWADPQVAVRAAQGLICDAPALLLLLRLVQACHLSDPVVDTGRARAET